MADSGSNFLPHLPNKKEYFSSGGMLSVGPPTSAAFSQRSKTAPTALVDSHGDTVDVLGEVANGGVNVGTISGSYVSRNRNRTKKPVVFFHAKTISSGDGGALHAHGLDWNLSATTSSTLAPPLVSPRHDLRDNPFNLAGFFPSRPGSPDHPVEWARCPPPAVVADVDERTKENIGAGWKRNAPSARSLSMNALDEYAREVIAKESKLGILGLARVPSFIKSIKENYFGSGVDQGETGTETYPSSAAIDEPFDADTLWESMQSLRAASSEREANALPDRVPSLGLFSAATELEMEDVQLGWATALYSKLLGPEV